MDIILQSVADAVLSFVYALDLYYRNECEGNLNNRCKAITDFTGTNKLAMALYQYLRNVSFTGKYLYLHSYYIAIDNRFLNGNECQI